MVQKSEQRQLVWEELKSSKKEEKFFDIGWTIYRTKVPGGWLVLVMHNTSGLTFYPDPEHRWDGGSTT